MIRTFLSASLIFLQILTQTASAMEFRPMIVQLIPAPVVQVPSDILENKNLGSHVTPFLFSKISESVVNDPLTNGQGIRISSGVTPREMLSNPAGWMLTTADYANPLALITSRGNPSSNSSPLSATKDGILLGINSGCCNATT